MVLQNDKKAKKSFKKYFLSVQLSVFNDAHLIQEFITGHHIFENKC